MKTAIILTAALVYSVKLNAQYFQRWFGSSASPSKQHYLYDGVCTRHNSNGNDTSFYNVGVGVAHLSYTDSAGLTKYDEVRFIRTSRNGNTVYVNKGFAFKNDADSLTNKWYNSKATSVCANGYSTNGGYVAVGRVSTNGLTGTVAKGGADALISRISNSGTVNMQYKIDFRSGSDVLNCVIAANNASNTYYACGASVLTNNTNLIVMKFSNTGSITWANTYRLNISGSAYQSKVVGNSICQSPDGGTLFIAGLINDPQTGTGDDGLIVSVDASTGNFIGATAYQYATDDQYTVIKPMISGEYLVGGIVSGNGLQSMFMGRANTLGSVYVHKTLTAVNGITGGNYNTTAYDALERPNTSVGGNLYFTGTRASAAGGSGVIVVKTDLTCTPSALYNYNDVGLNQTAAIDYSDTTDYSAGIRIFSGITDATAIGKTDAYISRIYFNGATCNEYCPSDSFVLQVPVYTTYGVSEDTTYTKKIKTKLRSIAVNYNSDYICNQSIVSCGSNARLGESMQETVSWNNNLAFYPNPATSKLHVSFTSLKAIRYEFHLLDISGRNVLQLKSTSQSGENSIELNIEKLSKGIYQLVFEQNGMREVKKLVVE